MYGRNPERRARPGSTRVWTKNRALKSPAAHQLYQPPQAAPQSDAGMAPPECGGGWLGDDPERYSGHRQRCDLDPAGRRDDRERLRLPVVRRRTGLSPRTAYSEFGMTSGRPGLGPLRPDAVNGPIYSTAVSASSSSLSNPILLLNRAIQAV